MGTYRVIAGDGMTYGPVDDAGLLQWLHDGRVSATTSIRCRSGKVVQCSALPFVASVLGLGNPSGKDAPPVPYPLSSYVVTTNSLQARIHELDRFPIAAVVFFQIITLGLFSLIHFGLMHDKMPKLRYNDPSAGKAIGYMLIPFFNLYWMFFMYIRLCDRIAEQRVFRGLPASNLRSHAIGACVVSLIPFVGPLVCLLILDPIFLGLLQSKVNNLADASAAELSQQQSPVAAPPAA